MSSSAPAFGASSDVLAFWFAKTPDMDKWFVASSDYDEEIRTKFTSTLRDAERGDCIHWLMSANSYVAHVVLLDQFSRQIYRGSGQAYQNDLSALTFARMGIHSYYPTLNKYEKMFVLLPFMHSENLQVQEECVLLVDDEISTNGSVDPFWVNVLRHATGHCEVIRRFGRFPKRNTVLGRKSTDKELAYIRETPNIPY
jgi:uncharacterized protein (DUF924 family)